ncbi:MAG TPA: hypothetical protein VL068_08140 [Microthrixaceae bacterium]|nr:hypothetical protein [Microthrixaceae bacterium]
MSAIQNPAYKAKLPGRKAVPIGVALIVLSIVIGVVGTALTLGRFDSSFTRDVVINGNSNPRVPGRLAFEVTEPISGGGNSVMRVGVAVDYEQSPAPTCQLQTADGEDIAMSAPTRGTDLFFESSDNLTIIGTAELDPGKYVAICEREESVGNDNATFTVGRALDVENLGEFAPVLWFLGIAVLSGLMFLIGIITLTVGLFRRNRGRKALAGQYPGGPYPGGPYPGGPYPGGPYPGGPQVPGGYPNHGGAYPGQQPSGYPPPPHSAQPQPPSQPPGSPAGYPPGPPTGAPASPPTAPPPAGEPEYPWRAPSPQPPPGPAAPPQTGPGSTGPGSTGPGETGESGSTPPPPSGWTVPPSKR